MHPAQEDSLVSAEAQIANLSTTQRLRLRDLLRYNLKTVRAYLLK
jgi:transposase